MKVGGGGGGGIDLELLPDDDVTVASATVCLSGWLSGLAAAMQPSLAIRRDVVVVVVVVVCVCVCERERQRETERELENLNTQG